jgi:hypothetical protein
MMKQLASLPKDLLETYDRIILCIEAERIEDAKRFLQWIAFSARPMSLEEIAEAVVVGFVSEDGPVYDPERRYKNSRNVLDVCSSLVSESDGMMEIMT